MQSCSIAIAVLLACSSQALADPPKRAPAQPDQIQPNTHELVLASADAVRAQPSGAQPASVPHRIARITTCRCGDPQPGDTVDDKPGQ